jgi:hypothetical protein
MKKTCHSGILGESVAFLGGSTSRAIKTSAAGSSSCTAARVVGLAFMIILRCFWPVTVSTALAYDWCGSHEGPIDGLPSKVIDIPIEGPVKALRWLQRHKSVRNKPVAIHGVGAELAMIIATLPRDRMVPRLAAVSYR